MGGIYLYWILTTYPNNWKKNIKERYVYFSIVYHTSLCANQYMFVLYWYCIVYTIL